MVRAALILALKLLLRCGKLREKLQGTPHLVPLPKQAVAVLRGPQPLTGYASCSW